MLIDTACISQLSAAKEDIVISYTTVSSWRWRGSSTHASSGRKSRREAPSTYTIKGQDADQI
jgi:hypothetical protein